MRDARIDAPKGEAGLVRLAPRVFLLDDDATTPALAPDVLVLRTAPSRAFGDGSHPTTRLCARLVDTHARQRAPVAVLDVGTGTGVLARIARAHGAQIIIGTDIDGVALESARVNALLDDHPIDITFANAAPDAWGQRFDLVVANILTPVLLVLADAIARALVDGGTLFLSGFTRPEVPRLKVAFDVCGLRVVKDFSDGEWIALVLQKSAPGA